MAQRFGFSLAAVFIVFQPTKMNGNLPREIAQILGTTGHLPLRVLPTMVGNSVAEKRYTTPRKG